eukprot:2106589-Rhodomonas_salina.2
MLYASRSVQRVPQRRFNTFDLGRTVEALHMRCPEDSVGLRALTSPPTLRGPHTPVAPYSDSVLNRRIAPYPGSVLSDA